MKRFLLLGGTGFLGRALCERLVGWDVDKRITVATRRLVAARSVQFLPTTVPIECDVHDDAQLERLVAGHDAVVNLIGILHGSAGDFDRAHVQLARRLATACERTGVKRVLQVSALGVNGHGPSHYLRSKAEAESVLRGAALDLTVLRPSVMFGTEDRFLNLFAGLQLALPIVPLAAADARLQPVWVEDVAEALLRCLQRLDTIGQTYECAGPQVFTLSELVRLAGRYSGRERAQLRLGQALGGLQAWFMEMLPGTPLISRDNLRSLGVPNVAGGQYPGLAALDITPTALQAVAPGYLTPGQGIARMNRWRALTYRY